MRYGSFLLLTCIAIQGYCQGKKGSKPRGSVSRVGEKGGRKVTLAAFQTMITKSEASTRASAKKIAPDDPTKYVADRTVLSDLCMGADQDEHDQIAEGVLVCLVVVSRNASEIPLSKAYIEQKSGKIIDLPLLATMSAEASKTLKTDGTIGRNVWVGLYWAPKARTIEGELFVDFAANRNHFSPDVVFPLPRSFGKKLIDRNPKDLLINYGVMKELIEREYPGMDLAPSFLEEMKQAHSR